jgi:hypothetical protein
MRSCGSFTPSTLLRPNGAKTPNLRATDMRLGVSPGHRIRDSMFRLRASIGHDRPAQRNYSYIAVKRKNQSREAEHGGKEPEV